MSILEDVKNNRWKYEVLIINYLKTYERKYNKKHMKYNVDVNWKDKAIVIKINNLKVIVPDGNEDEEIFLKLIKYNIIKLYFNQCQGRDCEYEASINKRFYSIHIVNNYLD